MLGIQGLAGRGLAQPPVTGAVTPPVTETVPAWRRLLAQLCNDALLNFRPTNDDVRDIIAHMFAECWETYPDAPRSLDALAPFLPPDALEWSVDDSGPDILVRLSEVLRDDDDDQTIRALLFASVNMTMPAPRSDEDAVLEALLRASVS